MENEQKKIRRKINQDYIIMVIIAIASLLFLLWV